MGFKVETNDLNQPQSRWDLCHENKDHVKSFLSSANHQNVKSHNGLCAVANLTSSTRFFFLLCLLVQKIRYGWNLQYIKDVTRFFGPWSVMFSFSWFLFFNTAAGKKKEKKTQTMFPSLLFFLLRTFSYNKEINEKANYALLCSEAMTIKSMSLSVCVSVTSSKVKYLWLMDSPKLA